MWGNKMNYLGIDIGGTAVKLGIVTEDGTITITHTKDVAFDCYETPIIETVMVAIDELLNAFTIDVNTLKGIGVSATGQIDVATGKVIGVGGNIKNWCDTMIKQELESRYHLKTTVLNDANAMILGEAWLGAAKGKGNVVGITIGTGVGGGIIVNHQILHGKLGIAGEVGHFSIDQDGLRCTCGNTGCYEQYASMTALVKKVEAERAHLNIPSDITINGRYIFDELRIGNAQIKPIVEQWIEQIGKGLVSLTHLFNPEVIVIGGGVSKQDDLFIQPLCAYVISHVMKKFKEDLRLVAATLGNDAGLVGAVYYHQQQMQ